MSLPPLRAATVEDTEAIVALLRIMHREAPAGRWSEAKVRGAVHECLTRGVIVLSMSNGEPVATLGVCPGEFWWSEDPLLTERWIFVHPQHRRAPHARSLLRMAKQLARDAGWPLLAGVTSNIRTEGKVGLFVREFGAPIGASFLVNA